ncbi:DUF6705 family protein [Chryseobacterium sp. SIMBA_028]|uniref:DUF6705 family protein n=1 Tax=Chryseobacterium sp. SIMBA_028 TaxID=3085771 RepID=UPI003978165C
MRNALLILGMFAVFSCNAQQIYPLRTYTEVPANSYIKDLNDELLPYEGTWKGAWNGKTIWVYFNRIKKHFTYLENRPYYNDILIGKFKIVNTNGSILFDNTNLSDENTKIKGNRFFSVPNVRYMLNYNDPDLCNVSGKILINFTGSSKTQLSWKFNYVSNIITADCSFYNTEEPEVFPEEIILTKQ